MPKINLVLISDHSARKRTFNKRAKGILKKVDELTTLCGVDGCAVIYNPFNSNPEPEVWPSNLGVTKVLEKFEKLTEIEKIKGSVTHEDFVLQNIAKVEKRREKWSEENKEDYMKKLMFEFLRGKGEDLRINDNDRQDLCKFIDQYLKDLINHKKELLNKFHFENGESSSMATARDIAPTVAPVMEQPPMAQAGSNHGLEHVNSLGRNTLGAPVSYSSQRWSQVQPIISSNQGLEHVNSLGRNTLNAPVSYSSQQRNQVSLIISPNQGLEHVNSLGRNTLNAPVSYSSQLRNQVHPIISPNQGLEHVNSLGRNTLNAPVSYSSQQRNQVSPIISPNQGLEHVNYLGRNTLNAPVSYSSQLRNQLHPIISPNQGLEAHVNSLGRNTLNAPVSYSSQLWNEVQPITSSNHGPAQVTSLASNLLPSNDQEVYIPVTNQGEFDHPNQNQNHQQRFEEETMKLDDLTCFPWMDDDNYQF